MGDPNKQVAHHILVSVNANLLSTTGDMLELNNTVDESKESVVGADAYVVTGMDLCATLSYKDVAGDNGLTVTLLNTETLGLRITTVLGRTNALLVGEEL